MEILILGVVVVGLMAYASTKLKKAAALALEPEEIETDEFSVTKPAGFISVASPRDGLLFHAYTPEFDEETPKLRKAEATIRRTPGQNIDDVLERLARSGRVVYDRTDADGVGRTVKTENDENGFPVRRFIRLLPGGRGVYQLQFDTPVGTEEEFAAARNEMNNTFDVKR